jgi:SAM-dependent methyltransferase
MTTSATTGPTIEEIKARTRQTWAAGNYDAVATGIWSVGERIVKAVAVRPGERVLDVAAGTGNAAIRAASAGGTVTALDLTPEMFVAGRRRAAEAGVDVTWVEGDAEALPFEDESFDVVLSTFGVMFAPRHAVAARELARVVRRGGRIGVATWAPDGTVAHLFRTIAAELPPPPNAEPPLAWGDPAHVEEIFAGTGLTLRFERDTLPIDPEIDVEDVAAFYIESFGPLVTARKALAEQGRWDAFAPTLHATLERMLTAPAAYVVITGTKR